MPVALHAELIMATLTLHFKSMPSYTNSIVNTVEWWYEVKELVMCDYCYFKTPIRNAMLIPRHK